MIIGLALIMFAGSAFIAANPPGQDDHPSLQMDREEFVLKAAQNEPSFNLTADHMQVHISEGPADIYQLDLSTGEQFVSTQSREIMQYVLTVLSDYKVRPILVQEKDYYERPTWRIAWKQSEWLGIPNR